MNCKKMIVLLMAQGLMLANCSAINCYAVDTDVPAVLNAGADNIDTAGLINYYSLSISASTRSISITAWTYGSDVMASIGFKNIEIQYSSNGTSGWLMEYSLADDLVTNETLHTKNSESHGVHGGYYYRVVLDHYAKETGFWFPGSESIPNTSNVVWVPRG